MIAYEISRKKEVQTQQYPAAVLNADVVGDALREERLRRQQNLAEGNKPDSQDLLWAPRPNWNREESGIRMTKLEYARYLSAMVYPRFPKGTLVTMRNIPFVPGNAPKLWFKVLEIQEIHYMAMIDRETRDPKCIGLWSPVSNHLIPTWYPPAKLRTLQPEEVKAIDDILRNKEGAQQDGPPTITGSDDPSTGRDTDLFEERKPEEGNI